MDSIINIGNNNNRTGHYPLFLGDKLGLHDNINVSYPEIAKLRDELLGNKWKWNEISLAQDARDILNPKLAPQVDVMITTLSFQMAGDAIASRSIEAILGAFCSNNEADGMLKFWTWTEYVHGMTYSEIVRSAFRDSLRVFEAIKANINVLKRAESVGKTFGYVHKLALQYQMGVKIPQETLMAAILKFLAALVCLETISFGASFASTFALVDSTKCFTGIGTNVQLIAKDELIHSRMGMAMLNILKGIPEWYKVFKSIQPEIDQIHREVMTLEFTWSPYLFSQGRQILGLNSKLLDEYTVLLSDPVCEVLEIKNPYAMPASHPLPWMNDWLDLNKSQKAAQEQQLNNYVVNAALNDLGEEPMDGWD